MTAKNGITYIVRYIDWGDREGHGFCILREPPEDAPKPVPPAPMIEFFDTRTKLTRYGRFVSSYRLEKMLVLMDKGGLNFHGLGANSIHFDQASLQAVIKSLTRLHSEAAAARADREASTAAQKTAAPDAPVPNAALAASIATKKAAAAETPQGQKPQQESKATQRLTLDQIVAMAGAEREKEQQ